MKIYDAENQILGRLSSTIAKNLLNGEEIVIVNAEKSVLSGDSKQKVKHYFDKIKRGDPSKGPFFPKYPNEIVRRTIRGMLPWHSAKGRTAFKKLKVFIDVPEEFKNKQKEKIEAADATKLKTTYMTLGNISVSIGAKKRW